MKANLARVQKLESSFLSCEKDYETILKKLFIESQPHSDELKRLLVINTSDCMNKNNTYYNQVLKKYDLATLKEDGYINVGPVTKHPESDEVKAYLTISMDNYTPNATNPHYRDCIVAFYIVTHTDYWDIGDYQIRPTKIAGYIDGLLDKTKLSGIGVLNFLGFASTSMSNDFMLHTLTYTATHGNDDIISVE